jgi:hypothetical protein
MQQLMTTRAIVLLIGDIFGLALGCPSRATTPAAQTRETLREVAARTPFTASPPRSATITDGVPSIVLQKGFGKVRPRDGNRLLIGLSFIAYNTTGKIESETPFTFHDFDTSNPQWKAVLTQMVAGEIRRMWIREERGTRVYDVDLVALGETPKRRPDSRKTAVDLRATDH